MVHFIFIAPMHSYVTNVLVYNVHMTIFSRVYSYVLVCTRMLLVCTRMLLVCYSYVLVCYSYVTCMLFVCYSYVLVCTRMLLVCTRMLLVCYSCVVLVTIGCSTFKVPVTPKIFLARNKSLYRTKQDSAKISSFG